MESHTIGKDRKPDVAVFPFVASLREIPAIFAGVSKQSLSRVY